MATSRPWVPWYPADILQDLKYLVLSDLAKLAYRELLDHLWLEECALPDNPRKLAALLKKPLEEFEPLWREIQDPDDPCFIPHPDRPGLVTNKRMLAEWRKAEDAAKAARRNGRKGGRPPKTQPTNTTKEKTQAVLPGLAKQNPDESYPHPQSEKEEEKHPSDVFCPEPQNGSGPQPVLSLPLVDGTEFGVTQSDVNGWAESYPALGEAGVLQCLRNMREWCISNAPRRKTRRGIRRFITNWLTDKQDKGGLLPRSAATPADRPRAGKENPYERLTRQKTA